MSKIPKNLTQIAFGIGSIDANPELWDIMEYTRAEGYIPNITINGTRMTQDDYDELASVCGAVAVSNYGKDLCYNAVQKLNEAMERIPNATLRQVNIHQLLAKETLDTCWDLLKDVKEDKRLGGLNAAVFLLLKPKGKRNKLTQLRNGSLYRDMITYALDNKLRIGFDSCTAPSFLRAIDGRHDYKRLAEMAEACESSCFSWYVDVDGVSWPCSFSAGEPEIEGINLLEIDDFIKDVWNAPSTVGFRDKLIKSHECHGCRRCPIWDLEIDK